MSLSRRMLNKANGVIGVISRISGIAFAGVLAVASSLAMPNAARAALVDLVYDLILNGMGTGTCPGGVCGTVTVTGDTTTSLTYVVDLATGAYFYAQHIGPNGTGDALFFELTDIGANPTFTLNPPISGNISGRSYDYNKPFSGAFAPDPGNFPGKYSYDLTCNNNTAGDICASSDTSKLSFTADANGGTLVIGAPNGEGPFAGDMVAFVASISISGSCAKQSCTAGTGFVGTGVGVGAPVPEPSTWAMMLIGFLGLGYAGYRRAIRSHATFAA